ncbi:MAG: 50S ribosomal protein L23, partial [Anaerolineae bacterium]
KHQVKQAVETVFEVTVERVRIINVPAKRARRYGRREVVRKPGWKKALVTLSPGDRIEFFEGV